MTDNTSFFREVDEDVRREQLEKFWQKYGRLLVGAALLAVVATAVMTYLGGEQNQKYEQATTQVAEVLQSLKPDNMADIRSKLDALAPTLPEGQTVVARLYSAGLASEDNDRAKALAQLADLGKDERVNPLYRDLARMISIQLRLDSDDPAQLKSELEPLMGAGQPWRFSAREAAAMLAIKTGDKQTAHDLFEQLKNDADCPTSIRDRATKFAAVYQ